MNIDYATEEELERWYLLRDHDKQLALINDPHRFKVVAAGRRSGKTERFKRYVTRAAFSVPGGRFFAGAPTRQHAKDIFWEDLKLLTFSSLHSRHPLETELRIFLPNNSTLTVIGMDEPRRFEGQPWTGGGFDEFADMKDEAWSRHIEPALDTVDPRWPNYRAWCWLFGVPEGRNHFFDRFEYGRTANDPQWKSYHWKSAEILPEDVILAKKMTMSALEFRQEYEASFETAEGVVYSDYDVTNYTFDTVQPYEEILWCHDQNYTPLSSAIAVKRDEKVLILDEIVLESAISRQSALEFVEKFKFHKNKRVKLYGDPAGRAGEKHGQDSDYTELENVLLSHGWMVDRRVALSAPLIKDRQNVVRANLCSHSGKRRLYVNPIGAPTVHEGFSKLELKKGSTFQEKDCYHQHITTAVGYMMHKDFRLDDSPADSPIIRVSGRGR
jgi:hypothetical protein